MRFQLLDRIEEWESGRFLVATKLLTAGEEYLADHFPIFPVMPGVLMLQAAVEASSWLWRISDDFRLTVMVAREARNVKYGTFVQPGMVMSVRSELTGVRADQATFQVRGRVADGDSTIKGQVVLAGYCLHNRRPDGAAWDERLRNHWRERWNWLTARRSG